MGLLIFLMIGPPFILLAIAIIMRAKNDKRAKLFFILAGVYLLIALGTCGYTLATFTLDTK